MIANRISNAIANHSLLSQHNISSSVGATSYVTGDTAETIFKRADSALYQAKEAGKNLFIAA